MKILCFILGAASMFTLAMPSFAQSKGKSAEQKPTPVIVAQAYNDDIVDKVEAIGSLKANETITLASTVTETVTAVNFQDGQRVKKGDILVEMTSTEEKALLEQQKALVKEASQQLERAKELSKNGAASTSDLNERQREYSSAHAGMEALQSRLEDHIIVAPFDGIVGLRNISVGALLTPGSKITTLDDDSVMKLDFSVPSILLPSLKPGVEIISKADGYKETFKGEISAIDSQIDETTRSVIVRAIIPNSQATLKPGLLMTVQLLKDPRNAILVPETAIIPEGRRAFVMVVNDANPPMVEKREVTLGSRRPGNVEITENLKAGEKVITQGTMVAQDKKPVTILTEQKKGESLQDVLKRLSQPKTGDQQESKTSAKSGGQ